MDLTRTQQRLETKVILVTYANTSGTIGAIFRNQTESFPFSPELLGRVRCPAKGAGNEMSQWILKSNGHVVPRRTSRPLTVAELHSVMEVKKRKIFDGLIERRWGTCWD